MVKDANFTINDIPICKNTTNEIPQSLITYEEAKTIYFKQIKTNSEFHDNSFVCFYLDDYKFDSFNGIWFKPKTAYNNLKHFEGIITPDFSTYADFPYPLKIYNTYRMRAFGYWYGTICKKKVINNIRWGDEETYSYCFDGIEKGTTVCIGSIASGLKEKVNRQMFNDGIKQIIDRIEPKIILVYGSINYPIFKQIEQKGIKVVEFKSKTAKYFERRNKDV